jgi:hypothetical protein
MKATMKERPRLACIGIHCTRNDIEQTKAQDRDRKPPLSFIFLSTGAKFDK